MKKVFPTLYAKASTGKVKVWRIHAEETDHGAEIVTEYGYQGSDKLQTTRVEVNQGKNVGRSNETTPFEQACLEAESKWNKKQDKKYTQSDSGASEALLPMLAHDYKKRGHHVEWPAYVQPKLNGIRCLATRVDENTVSYTSRGGKEFTALEHLTPILLEKMKIGEVLDGELFNEEMTFQEIVSAVKRSQDSTQRIQYWIYDIVLADSTFEERQKRFFEIANPNGKDEWPSLVPVWTVFVKDEEEMLLHHGKHIELGLEGTIIRNRKGLYRKDFRSPDLQKYKDFVDEEFEIIGGKEGVGLAKGTVTWTCITEEGKEFDVRPRGTVEERKRWWNNLSEFIGKRLTVRYQNRSDSNIPIFPVGIAVRDYE